MNKTCRLEPLERRTLLSSATASALPANVLATFDGALQAGARQQIPIHLTAQDWTLPPGGDVELGFDLFAPSGGALDPSAIAATDSTGKTLRPVTSNPDLNNFTQSAAIFDLPLGDYTLNFGGDRGTTGAYQLQVYLGGDANGDRAVNQADNDLIHSILGNNGYILEADADLDGRVTGYDLAQQIHNTGASTILNPLSVTLGLVPAPTHVLPNGMPITNLPSESIAGLTNPGANVRLDLNGNNFSSGSTSAGPAGTYTIPVTLHSDLNTLTVLASDDFGQHRTVSTQILLDTTPPAIKAALADDTGFSTSDGLTSDPTVSGSVTDNYGVADLKAGLDGVGPTIDVFAAVQSNGGFTFTRQALEQIYGRALADGPHTLHLQATDIAGNVTGVYNLSFTLDTVAPALSAQLAHDTGISNHDALTNDSSVSGSATDANGVAALLAGFDSAAPGQFVNVLPYRTANGSFRLNQAAINQINGGVLPDGPHALHLQGTDAAGNVSAIYTINFTLDTIPPAVPSFNLDPSTDSGTLGDSITTFRSVILDGQTEAGARVSSGVLGAVARGDGSFQLPGVILTDGVNGVTVTATDAAGNSSTYTHTLTHVAPQSSGQVILDWDQAAINAIELDASDPQYSSRALGIMSAAAYDAVNSVDGSSSFLYVHAAAAPGASDIAAAAQAAHDALVYLYPAQQNTFDALLNGELSAISDGTSRAQGVSVGQFVASTLINLRSHDGSTGYVDYAPGSAPGQWQPTYPNYAPALRPNWATLQPFLMSSPSQFRPAGPPALNSAPYAADVNQVQQLGSAGSTARTADQTQAARFWNDGSGSTTPPGHWDQIASQLAGQQNLDLASAARLFAELNVGMADAGIAVWDAKFAYNFWRPITAIRQANSAGNSAVTQDPNWTPLITTPPFPEYVSGHSAFSATAATILDAIFGSNVSFSIGSASLTGVTRSFASFDAAAQEAAMSRIWGGIHFNSAVQDGMTMGKALGSFVLAKFQQTTDTAPPSVAILSPAPNTAFKANPTITGQVTDNLSGVASLQYALDAGSFAPVSFDSAGHFTLTAGLALDGSADGAHVLHFKASDYAGNPTGDIQFQFTLDTQAPALSLTSPASGGTLSAGELLSGSVSGTGSAIVALSYRFDSGTSMPVSFSTPDGAFSQALELSHLSAGSHALAVSATDAAGNTATTTLNVSLTSMIPLTISDFTPTSGASDVGATFRPKITFSRPINVATLNAADFFATDTTGTKLPATIVPADDGTYAWLFFASPMPGASMIHVTVDGSAIAAPDGSNLDAAGNGTPGSKLTWGFSTVSLAALPNTSLTGIVADPGPDLQPGTIDDVSSGPDGVLATADDLYKLPIAGVTVSIAGTNISAVTGPDGKFTFPSIPSGDVKLVVEGPTATNAPAGFYFPEMVMDLNIRPGQANTVMAAMQRSGTGNSQPGAPPSTAPGVYLPRLRSSILQFISPTGTTDIGVNASSAPDLTDQQRQQLHLDVPGGTAIGMNGQKMSNVQMGISTVPPSMVMDMLPPGLLQHSFDITIQAPGVATFSQPVPISFPNVFNAAPGTKEFLLSFDHTTGRLVIDGTMTVSADGKSVQSDPGSGITHPGWHSDTPPGENDNNNGNDDPPDPKEPPPTSDDQDVTFDVGVSLDSEFTPLDIQGRFGFDLPTQIFGGDGPQPVVWSPELKIPQDGIPFSFEASTTFTVPDYVAYFIPEIDFGLFTAELKAGIEGTLKAQLELKGQGFNPDAEISAHVAANVKLFASFQIQDTFLCLLPFGIGNWICQEHEISVPIVGSPDIDIPPEGAPPIPFPLPKTPVVDFDVTAGPIAQLSVDTQLEVTPTVFIHREPGTAPDPPAILPNIVTSDGFNNDPRLYYRYFLADGQQVAGRSDDKGNFNVFLPPGMGYMLYLWSPRTNRYAIQTGTTGTSGSAGGSAIMLTRRAGIDTDRDGLPDVAEIAIGTDPNNPDTNGDGISDLGAIQGSLDPLSNLPAPTGVIGSTPTPGSATSVDVEVAKGSAQRTAYVTTGSAGMTIVDVSQPGHPVVESQLALPGNATSVAVDPQLQIAAVADNAGGLVFVDVADPTNPVIVAAASVDANLVAVDQGVAYAAVGNLLIAFSLTDGQEFQSLAVASGQITGLAREGSVLYTMDSAHVLRAVDISSGHMVARGSLALPAGAAGGGQISVGGGIAYVGNEQGTSRQFGGFATVNVSNPDNLVLLAGVQANGIAGWSIAANGSGLALAVGSPGSGQFGNIADLVNVSNPANTAQFVTRYALPQFPFDVAIAGGIAYVADGAGGLQVINYEPFDTHGVPPSASIDATSLDVDPATDGIQVYQDSTLAIKAVVSDDVQVRDVQLLVNGQVVQDALSFPFNLSTIAAGADPSATTMTIQIRATDTGGNSTLSDVYTLNLVADTTPPAILGVTPADGSSSVQGLRVVTVSFSKPLAAQTVNAANFELQDANGNGVAAQAVELLNDGKLVQLTYAPLAAGSYQVVLNASAITDRAGNVLGSANILEHFTLTAVVQGGLTGEFYALPVPPTTALIAGNPSVLDGMTPTVTQQVLQPIDFNSNNPFASIGVDVTTINMAASFKGWINIPTGGTVTFATVSDDGSVLWIDGNLVVNSNGLHSAAEATGSINLTAGLHSIEVDYFEAGGVSDIVALYQLPSSTMQVIPQSALFSGDFTNPTPGGLFGRFYHFLSQPSASLIGTLPSGLDSLTPEQTAIAPTVDFHSYGISDSMGAAEGLYGAQEQIAASFSGYIYIATPGTVTFYTTSDDGSMLYINNALVVSNDFFQGFTRRSGTYVVPSAGYYPIRLDYFQGGGAAALQFSYTPAGGTTQVVPSSVLFTANPNDPSTGTAAPGLNGRYYWIPAGTSPATIQTPAALDSLTPTTANVVQMINFSDANNALAGLGIDFGTSNVAAVFTGYIYIDSAGPVTFATRSDDGSMLYVDGQLVVSSDFVQGMVERSGSIVLNPGYHAIRLEWFQGGGASGLQLLYSMPGVPEQLIPASVLYSSATG